MWDNEDKFGGSVKFFKNRNVGEGNFGYIVDVFIYISVWIDFGWYLVEI